MDFSLVFTGRDGNELGTLDSDRVRFFSGLHSPAPGAAQKLKGGMRRLAKEAYVRSPCAVRKAMLAASRRGRFVYAPPGFSTEGSGGAGKAELLLDGRKAVFDLSGGGFSLGLFVEMVRQVVVNDQYLLGKSGIRGKTVVDAGASVGVFSIFAFLLGAGKVYAFEPDPHSFGMLSRSIALSGADGVVVPVGKALGSSEGSLRMEGHGGACEAQMTTLDSFLQGERVDFIKMDVEGHEKEILSGAAKSISSHRPIISMSAYHKPHDEEDLPAALGSIDKTYACNLIYLDEKDLYCKSRSVRNETGL